METGKKDLKYCREKSHEINFNCQCQIRKELDLRYNNLNLAVKAKMQYHTH